jgi:TonB family protein
MDPALFANLLRWNLQIVLLVIGAAAVLHLVRLKEPVLRHAFWRSVLVIALVLPAVQPWRTPSVGNPADIDVQSLAMLAGGSESGAAVGGASMIRAASIHLRRHGLTYVVVGLVVGAVLRLLWLTLGVLRLRRLRRDGERATATDGYDEISSLIEAGADVRRVERLGQPVTFGVLKPAVLLPASFPTLPIGVQRAVLAHELLHVHRRDWAWVLMEEILRAAFWFNPAMAWLLSRVQASREEVVDELTVQVTNARKTYLEALLFFADQPTLFPAAPFARRHHLFERMLLVSREAAMSSTRLVVSSIVLALGVIFTSAYASTTFPLANLPALEERSGQGQAPPRDRRPGEAGPETQRERDLKQAIAANPTQRDMYFQLAGLQMSRGAVKDAEATMTDLKIALPNQPGLAGAIAQFYLKSGLFEQAVVTLEDAAAANPTNAPGYHLLATFYFEKVQKDKTLSVDQQRAYLDAGIAATDRALAINPDYVEALVYQNILLRLKANVEPDAQARQGMLARADALRNRAMELKQASGQQQMQFVPAPGQPGAPPPPPPPPPPGLEGQAPIRVGGNVRPPAKIRDVKPVYPAVAKEAGVQGVVIIEATIGTDGNIVDARVLRGQPLLDQAALEAVSQWQFAPTLLNGAPVPVIMTMTVNFTLQ